MHSNLRTREDRLELKDCDNQYRNEWTWTLLYSASCISSAVSIESSCHHMIILIVHGQQDGREASTTRFCSSIEALMAKDTSNLLNFISENRTRKEVTSTRV